MKPIIYFKHLPKYKRCVVYAETDCEKRVWISLKGIKDLNPLKYYLHELNHIRHPKWSEKRVIHSTALQWKRMTARQMFELGHQLFATWREEE